MSSCSIAGFRLCAGWCTGWCVRGGVAGDVGEGSAASGIRAKDLNIIDDEHNSEDFASGMFRLESFITLCFASSSFFRFSAWITLF